MQIIETSFCLLLSWVMYEILLRRETFFQLNRAYLLLMSLAAFVLPLLHFGVHHEEASPVILPFIVENYEVQNLVYQPFMQKIPLFSFTVGDILQSIFFIGFFYKIIKLSVTLWKINQLMGVCKAKKQKGITFLATEKNIPIWKTAKYVLALPLFCAFVLLFSFDLIAKIPTPLPQMEAFLDNFQKQSFTIQNDYNLQIDNDLQKEYEIGNAIEIAQRINFADDNFIFYWGSFQLKFQAANGNENYLSSSVKVSKSKLQDLVYHRDIPYFWNGKTLDEDFSFRISYLDSTTMTLQSLNVNRKEYLKTVRDDINNQLLSLLNKVKENGSLMIHELKTPSTVDKILWAKILLSNDDKSLFNTFSSDQNKELGDFLDKKLGKKIDTIKSNRMDFKWGEIGIMTKKVTKEIFLTKPL